MTTPTPPLFGMFFTHSYVSAKISVPCSQNRPHTAGGAVVSFTVEPSLSKTHMHLHVRRRHSVAWLTPAIRR